MSAENKRKSKSLGLIKWFNQKSGYGVIAGEDDTEYFLHFSEFNGETNSLVVGTPVFFIPVFDTRRDRYSSKNVRIIRKLKDWDWICKHVSKDATVSIEIASQKKVEKRDRVSFYTEVVKVEQNLVESAFYNVLKEIGSEREILFIKYYYDYFLAPENFIHFCDKTASVLEEKYAGDADLVLKSLYNYFGNNIKVDFLFEVWKKRRFELIARTTNEDFEISYFIMESNLEVIGKEDFIRILQYSYSSEFIEVFLDKKLQDLDQLSYDELSELYTFLEYDNTASKEERKFKIDTAIGLYVEPLLLTRGRLIGDLDSTEQIDKFRELYKDIPSYLNEQEQERLQKVLDVWQEESLTEHMRVYLWLRNDGAPPRSGVDDYFMNRADDDVRIKILSKVQKENSGQLLDIYFENFGFEPTFLLVQKFLRSINTFPRLFELKKEIFENPWVDFEGTEIVQAFQRIVKTKLAEEDQVNYFISELLDVIPKDLVISNIGKFNNSVLKRVFQNFSSDEPFISAVLEQRIISWNSTEEEDDDLAELFLLGQEFLPEVRCEAIEQIFYLSTNEDHYFKIWKEGVFNSFPETIISEYLKDDYQTYQEISTWISNGAVTKKKIDDFLFSFLSSQEDIGNLTNFRKAKNHIEYLVKNNHGYINKILGLHNPSFTIMLWLSDIVDDFSYEVLRAKFILFQPKDQVRIIKKLFYLRASNQFDLTVEKLESLTTRVSLGSKSQQ